MNHLALVVRADESIALETKTRAKGVWKKSRALFSDTLRKRVAK